ncbi:LysR family transcriptional regulator [Streptomyces sp. RFCAC02]|uniref:LysR family transcriptional regulator n=1 Tax=Streptomyces sp. RFCAC02 TaxID=2499143 RepID=UPI00101F7AA3|nr:LysR family transcriptional regulator [Streptomyces sp. RFCAC02]
MQSTSGRLDLNLLIALDALLEERSVAGAAHRLSLSSPAMSRALGRIRKALGDPVLVRSGHAMVPTPRAIALRSEVRELVERAQAVLTPAGAVRPETLERTFTLLADDALHTTVGRRLLEHVRTAAPGVVLRLVPEGPGDSLLLREGAVDLEIGVVSDPAPGTRAEMLFRDENVGVVRCGHPLLDGPVTVERYAAADHITASRRGRLHGPIDDLLAERGLRRRVVASVPTLTSALLLASSTDLVARTARRLPGDQTRRLGLATFPIPLDLPGLVISQAWHARFDADPAHRWLRACVRRIAASLPDGGDDGVASSRG